MESPDPEDLEGMADSLYRPTDHGELELDGSAARATLEAGANYHAWYFEISGGDASRISLETGPSRRGGQEIDTVMYLYRQQDDGTWGRYVFKNDNGDSSTSFASLRDRRVEPGEYRLIVKGYRACRSDGVESEYCGSFSVRATCDSGAACGSSGAPSEDDCGRWEAQLDDCQGLNNLSLRECMSHFEIERDDLRACCEADSIYTFCSSVRR
jgi:hypothetical protein